MKPRIMMLYMEQMRKLWPLVNKASAKLVGVNNPVGVYAY